MFSGGPGPCPPTLDPCRLCHRLVYDLCGISWSRHTWVAECLMYSSKAIAGMYILYLFRGSWISAVCFKSINLLFVDHCLLYGCCSWAFLCLFLIFVTVHWVVLLCVIVAFHNYFLVIWTFLRIAKRELIVLPSMFSCLYICVFICVLVSLPLGTMLVFVVTPYVVWRRGAKMPHVTT